MKRIKMWTFKMLDLRYRCLVSLGGYKEFPDENHNILLPTIPYMTSNYVRVILF